MFLLRLRQLPWCGDGSPASVPPPAEERSSPTNTLVCHPSSVILPSFAWFCIFLPTGKVLPPLSAVFCMCFCIWRCIPNVSVEREVCHIHELLCHLVFSWQPIFKKCFAPAFKQQQLKHWKKEKSIALPHPPTPKKKERKNSVGCLYFEDHKKTDKLLNL